MKQELEVITEKQVFGKTLKIYGTFEKPLFLAKDVAEWIEHTDAPAMIKSVDDNEKIKITPRTILGGLQVNTEYWFLTEDGLYEVLMQSRKPIAKEFKREVKTILKSFRQFNNELMIKDGIWNEYRSGTASGYNRQIAAIDVMSNESVTTKEQERRYQAEGNLLNKIVFGMTADQWRRKHPNLKGNQRDHATPEQLRLLHELQSANTLLQMLGHSYENRVQILSQFHDFVISLARKTDTKIQSINPLFIDVEESDEDKLYIQRQESAKLAFQDLLKIEKIPFIRNMPVRSDYGIDDEEKKEMERIGVSYDTQRVWDFALHTTDGTILMNVFSTAGEYDLDMVKDDQRMFLNSLAECYYEPNDFKNKTVKCGYMIIARNGYVDEQNPVYSFETKEFVNVKYLLTLLKSSC